MDKRKLSLSFWGKYSWEVTLGLFCIIAIGIASSLSPYYLDLGQILYSLQQTMSITSVIAIGFMFLILIGEMDISIPGMLALGAVLLGKLSSAGVPYGFALLIVFSLTTLFGMFNGYLIVKFSLPSMAVTLGMMGIYRAVALWIGGVEGFSRKVFKASYLWIGEVSFGVFPLVIMLLIILFLLSYIVLNHTVYGRLLYAVGNNRKATYFSGHNVKRTIISVYSIAGFMAGIGAMLYVGQYQSARSDNASNILLFVISCVALGGFNLSGGKGNVIGLVLSIFLLGTIQNGMGLDNVSGPVQTLVVGFILIIAIIIPTIAREINHRRLQHKR